MRLIKVKRNSGPHDDLMAEPLLEVEKDYLVIRLVEGQRIKDLLKLKTEFSNLSVFYKFP